MRLAVISDIHGNYKALEAVLEYFKEHPVDGLICLGDYVTDSPFPQRTMELIYRMRDTYPCYMVRGNREEYLLLNDSSDQGWKPSSATGTLYYTAQNLTQKDMDFFRELKSEDRICFPGYPTLMICHGTPGKVRGNMVIDKGLREQVMEELTDEYLLGGHSHNQELYCWQGKTYLNPGAVGLAIDGVGRRAQFALLESAEEKGKGIRWIPELVSISYDVEGFLADMEKAGLEECGKVLNRMIKKTLLSGYNYFFRCVEEVEKESYLQTGKQVPLAEVPEEIWEMVEERIAQ